MFDPELWELLADSFGRILLPDHDHSPHRYFLFPGDGDRHRGGAGAVCPYPGASPDRPLLCVGGAGNAPAGAAVCGVLRPSQRGNSHRSFSGSGAGLFSQ